MPSCSISSSRAGRRLKSEATGGAGIPCEDIKRFKGKCKPSGKAKAVLKLEDDRHDGKSVVIAFTGEQFERKVKGNRAKAKKCCFNATVVITLEDPPDCVKPLERTCR